MNECGSNGQPQYWPRFEVGDAARQFDEPTDTHSRKREDEDGTEYPQEPDVTINDAFDGGYPESVYPRYDVKALEEALDALDASLDAYDRLHARDRDAEMDEPIFTDEDLHTADDPDEAVVAKAAGELSIDIGAEVLDPEHDSADDRVMEPEVPDASALEEPPQEEVDILTEEELGLLLDDIGAHIAWRENFEGEEIVEAVASMECDLSDADMPRLERFVDALSWELPDIRTFRVSDGTAPAPITERFTRGLSDEPGHAYRAMYFVSADAVVVRLDHPSKAVSTDEALSHEVAHRYAAFTQLQGGGLLAEGFPEWVRQLYRMSESPDDTTTPWVNLPERTKETHQNEYHYGVQVMQQLAEFPGAPEKILAVATDLNTTTLRDFCKLLLDAIPDTGVIDDMLTHEMILNTPETRQKSQQIVDSVRQSVQEARMRMGLPDSSQTLTENRRFIRERIRAAGR